MARGVRLGTLPAGPAPPPHLRAAARAPPRTSGPWPRPTPHLRPLAGRIRH